MESVYKQSFTLSDMHMDCFRRLKPSVLLYMIQEVSANHAAVLGADWDTLTAKGLFWAIIRHRVIFQRLPAAGETITIETWPMPTTRVAYPRATVGFDAEGNELFRSVAVWVLMDHETRAMVIPAKSGVEVPGILRGIEADMPVSLPVKQLEQLQTRTVGYSELDRNGHMNNTYYLDWINDLLPAAFHREHPAKQLEICYLSECREGQQVRLNWCMEEDLLWVEAQRQDPKNPEKYQRVFASRLQF